MASQKKRGRVPVFHPNIKGLTVEVPAAEVADWLEQGWVEKQPPETPPATE